MSPVIVIDVSTVDGSTCGSIASRRSTSTSRHSSSRTLSTASVIVMEPLAATAPPATRAVSISIDIVDGATKSWPSISDAARESHRTVSASIVTAADNSLGEPLISAVIVTAPAASPETLAATAARSTSPTSVRSRSGVLSTLPTRPSATSVPSAARSVSRSRPSDEPSKVSRPSASLIASCSPATSSTAPPSRCSGPAILAPSLVRERVAGPMARRIGMVSSCQSTVRSRTSSDPIETCAGGPAKSPSSLFPPDGRLETPSAAVTTVT